MALQVWLPLDKDERNSGLGRVTTKLIGATLNQSGIEGPCHYFDGSDDFISMSGQCLYDTIKGGSNPFSIAFFVYHADATRAVIFGDCQLTGAINFNVELTTGHVVRFYWNGSPDYNITQCVVPQGGWAHVAIVYDGKQMKTYKDGALVATTSLTLTQKAKTTGEYYLGRDSRTGTTVLNGRLFDFRIYDNALSAEDVKELSRIKRPQVSAIVKSSITNNEVIFDGGGLLRKMTIHDVVQSGTSLYFTGGTSYAEFDGLNLYGGTVSLWFNIASKPTAQKVLYYDPTSKMVVGFLSDGNLLTAANGTKARYLTTGVTWGQWNNIVATYGADRHPINCWINGVTPSTGSNENWSNGGTVATIGRRVGAGNPDNLTGYLNDVRVYKSILTEGEAKMIFSGGTKAKAINFSDYMWDGYELVEMSGCTWLRLLHHNAPATNLFKESTKGNSVSDNLFSKLYLFTNSDRFKGNGGKFEFVAKEKLESSSAENTYRWAQTSNPTASTVTGYSLISQTYSAGRNFGLKNGGSYGFCHNGSTWWCCCGSVSAYQGGIPGFGGVVKTGYIDLYIRVDGTSYFN